MTVSSIIFGLGLAMLTVYFVARPFVQRSISAAVNPAGSARRQLLAQKAAIYAAIREIDADVLVGKLEVVDHQILRRRYLAEGVAVLKALDDLPAGDQVSDAIEADVARLSSGEFPSSTGSFCSECGAQADSGDKFCAKCGARLGGDR